MPASIFTDKSKKPGTTELKKVLGSNYNLWNEIEKYVCKKYPEAEEEWKYAGKSFGWGYRLKDKKRVIIYLKPCEKYFIVSFVFGEKAVKEALSFAISKYIKDIILSAKVYAEGRGFRIDVKDKKITENVKKLVDIKLSN